MIVHPLPQNTASRATARPPAPHGGDKFRSVGMRGTRCAGPG
ncbi:hypothetical protein RC1_0453 [Rhodospirillum centenum SW]|uniref:Uncharacterized protein n=1 Tax=Rhodospirillum centenum (strain ATCC 51521 / SW) TaxID=414684 RepID=B6IR06_RHOCS|nr:hypothetical protein RC1_0453 [Rhodospirillum centenum SW]